MKIHIYGFSKHRAKNLYIWIIRCYARLAPGTLENYNISFLVVLLVFWYIKPWPIKAGLENTMKGLVTKKHFFAIWSAFGFKKAFRVLVSRQPVALLELIK